MANVVIPENPEFNEALRIIETEDLVHANVVNPMFRTLLLNTIYLERRVAKMTERIDTLAIDNTYGGPELSADANIVDASAQFSVIRKTSSTASVQTLFQKAIDGLRKGLYQRLSFSVTVDGNKELHDSCRVFPDGRPSYDLAIAAAKDWVNKGGYMGSKVTIAPENVMHTYDAIIHMIKLGYNEINANCVYEEGWQMIHATVFYDQLKKLADYILEHNLDMENDYYISLFEENFFHPKQSDDLENWCGGNGIMLAVDPEGVIYPCLRYMESSLAGQQEPYSIGDVDTGICQCECHKCRVECLKKIDRRTQSTDECFNCPVAEGCSWCTAYNYQVFGTPDARATYICNMHKARALGNIYFWNNYYKKHGIDKHMENYVPEKWALDIITQAEWNMLNSL